jgi:hypothetical protein
MKFVLFATFMWLMVSVSPAQDRAKKIKYISSDKLSQVIEQCLKDQEEYYMDTCMESSSGYEDMTGSDAHFDGVLCGAQGVAGCVEGSL